MPPFLPHQRPVFHSYGGHLVDVCFFVRLVFGFILTCFRRVRDVAASAVHRSRVYIFIARGTCDALVDVPKFKDLNVSLTKVKIQCVCFLESHSTSSMLHRTLLGTPFASPFSSSFSTPAPGSSSYPSLLYLSMSPSTATLQGGLCFGRLAEQSAFTGYGPKSLLEVSSEHTPIVLPSRRGSLDTNVDDIATTVDASEVCDTTDVGRRTAKSKNSPFFTVWHPRHHPHFLMFCTRGTFRTELDKKKLVENSLFAICFLSVFLMFSMRIFWVYGHLPTRSENGVAQIQHVCPVVFGQLAVIVDCCCLVVM